MDPKGAACRDRCRNPRYAGCFVYGRSRTRKLPDGKAQHSKPAMEDWQVCIPQAHAGYIDCDEYCHNQETLMLELKALVNQAYDNDAVAEELNKRGRTDAQGGPLYGALHSRVPK